MMDEELLGYILMLQEKAIQTGRKQELRIASGPDSWIEIQVSPRPGKPSVAFRCSDGTTVEIS